MKMMASQAGNAVSPDKVTCSRKPATHPIFLAGFKNLPLRNKAVPSNFHAGNPGSNPGGGARYVGELGVILIPFFLCAALFVDFNQ